MAKIKFATLEDILERMANHEEFKMLDVLPADAYQEGHIPGAINVPLEKLSEKAPVLLNKTDTIIVYCGSYTCQASTKATGTLLKMGYKNTHDFKAGKKGWIQAGLELEK